VQQRRLGGDLVVGALGLGCRNLGPGPGSPDLASVHQLLDRAVERGSTLLDTADIYGGPGGNEELLGTWLPGRRHEVVLATKFGVRRPTLGARPQLRADPAHVAAACDASLARLRTEVIDLWFLHRVDPAVPVEETVGAMAALVAAGKVRHLGLCEITGETLRRAHAVHPIAAVQSEWSLWSRDLEADVVPTCRELGVGIVPFSPLGRGFLTGQIAAPSDLGPADHRRDHPRFQADALRANRPAVDELGSIAAAKGTSPGQVALAWLLAQGPDVVPIPGTKRLAYLDENLDAADVVLDDGDLAAIEAVDVAARTVGDRFPDMANVAGTTPPAGEPPL
jgi:aryl-alcohol dehydrogenase-like predicted oxidoreductase